MRHHVLVRVLLAVPLGDNRHALRIELAPSILRPLAQHMPRRRDERLGVARLQVHTRTHQYSHAWSLTVPECARMHIERTHAHAAPMPALSLAFTFSCVMCVIRSSTVFCRSGSVFGGISAETY